jgi:hypothetical protein
MNKPITDPVKPELDAHAALRLMRAMLLGPARQWPNPRIKPVKHGCSNAKKRARKAQRLARRIQRRR